MTLRRQPLAQRVAAALERTLNRCWWQPRANGLARALSPLAALYGLLARCHRVLARPQSVGLPVVVVGNLIVGGAGKTPSVIALVRLLRAMGWTPGVVSRGHGRQGSGVVEVRRASLASECGDEPLLIHLRSAAPVFVGRDRVDAARALRAAHPEVDLILSDDGLQHHRLARDVQIVVFDERGTGNRKLLPAGPLRAPLPASLPQGTLVLYNAAAPTTALPGWMATRRLTGLVELHDWWRGAAPDPAYWQMLAGRPLVAAAGIAAPLRFFDMLEAQGLAIVPLALPDHDDYEQLPWPIGTPDVVLTEKDAVKLRADRTLAGTRVWVAPLDLELEVAFAAALMSVLPPPPKPNLSAELT